MITLVIKGDLAQAFKAADAHGVELTSAAAHNRFAEIIASAPDHCMTNIMRWFLEPIDAPPYPPGALTFYTQGSA